MNRTSRVMVVDDEPDLRLTTRTTLEASGYLVVEAAGGDEALHQLRSAPVDLILMDRRMPLMEGLEILRHLREVGDSTPVVIVPFPIGGLPGAGPIA